MFEDFLNAVRNFKTSKTRTILSLLGIIIGVASVIMVTSIGQSATEDVKSSFGSSGLDLVSVSTGWARRNERIDFNEAFREELYAEIPGIKNIYYTNSFSGTLRNGGLDVNMQLKALEPGYFGATSLNIDYGRSFTLSEDVTGAQKVILGAEIIRFLFPEGEPIGKTVILQADGYRLGFEVIGVLEYSDAIGFEDPNYSAYVTRGFYRRKILPNATASEIMIQVFSQEQAPRVHQAIEMLAATKTNNPQALHVFSMQSILEQYDRITLSMNLLLSGIAAISLLVGGIGIMNIMIVSVTERKKEIGIRKALGASPAAIRNQFLVESATLTLFGGFIGILIGLFLSYLVVSFFNWKFSIQWMNCIIAFLFSALVGIFFGMQPAIRAAKLDPVEALAGE
ncbi:ABC transporter permease [Brucepastera parasyntrophica]|uniref:ABC transporter permease n=1 Tax=Brucepastera parasyntrophica TaxID=2880008 RepID=UPI00210A006D|nr:ABC transporter permease [Brucepastera parasyntrophica]ULQ60963.1 ABC transporter permease [Brucepastera parasyntrophica]